jgi:hypothetical protein
MGRLLVTAVVSGLLVAGSAEAAIVPQHGIRGVAIGMTPAQVRARLGQPVGITLGSNDFGPWTVFRYPGLRVSFQSGVGATTILTSSPAQRTAAGIGVGSTVAAAKAKVRGLKCLTEAGSFHCYAGRWSPGHVVTDLSIANGRVTRVAIGRVLD